MTIIVDYVKINMRYSSIYELILPKEDFMFNFSATKKITAIVLLICMLICSTGALIAVIAAEGDGEYCVPDHLADLVDPSKAESSFERGYDVMVQAADGSAKLTFTDSANGFTEDPYISLRLPSAGIDCQEYPYFAMLVKTNKSDIRGEIRFRTTTTGEKFPTQAINYVASDDWQLIVVNLMDLQKIYFAPTNAPYTGNYTEIRLDPFDNFRGKIPADTQYYIKAYGFYKTAEEAATFINFKSSYVPEEEETFDVNYADFWLGEAFEDPDNSKRMNWLSYGFTGSTSPVDQYLSEGYGGIVSNVRFNQNYLKDPNEFTILKRVYDYAAQKGMTLWIYDEYQWPSGKAYGLVLDNQKGREWESTGIEHIVINGVGGTASYTLGSTYGADEIGIMQAVLTDGNGKANVDVSSGSVSASASGNWTLEVYLLRYTYQGVEDRTDFYSLRHVDLLNPDTVKYFIEITHEQYKKYLGDSFKNITAFFTDEPQLGNRAVADYVVWTGGFAERFYETYGYHINIPSLFAGSTDYDRMVRMNYYQLVAVMFKESYIDQISEWCEANGVASSGHLLFEENMNDHIETYGGNFMQIVGGMTIPGADALWVDPYNLLRQNHIGDYMGLRYVASAAKNAGKNDVMIEYNPNAVGVIDHVEDPLGVSIGGLSITRLLGTNIYNVINPTRDYTLAELNTLNTYIGRLNTILDETVECGSLAVFYPIATVQAYHNADDVHSSEYGKDTRAVELNTNYQTFCLNLLQAQYLFTVLDDESICAAKINADGELVVGLGAYSTIVLPYTEYISVEALTKLAEFEEAGGTVLFYNSNITHGMLVDQEDEIAALMAGFENDSTSSFNGLMKKIRTAVSTNLTVKVSGNDAAKLLMGDFESADRDVTFLVNSSDTKMTVKWNYTDGYQGTATVYYPGNGNIVTVDLSEGAATVVIPKYEGVLIVREDENVSAEETTEEATEDITEDVTEENTEDVTSTNTDETTVEGGDETTVSNETDKDAPAKSGCKSSFGGVVAVAVTSTLVGATVFTKRRKKN